MRCLPVSTIPSRPISCLDWLGDALSHVARLPVPPAYRCDRQGKLRLICKPLSYEQITDAAFQPIREYGRATTIVMAHFLEVIEQVSVHTHRDRDRRVLSKQARLVLELSKESLPDPSLKSIRAKERLLQPALASE